MIRLQRPQMLIIMDGFGYTTVSDKKINAINKAQPKNILELKDKYPNTLLTCSGSAVGLPKGQVGNSEVGHLNIGTGRVVCQELGRINKEISTGEFFKNIALISIMKKIIKRGNALHICGLLSDGGVHSHINHLFALLEMAKRLGLKEIYIHAFLDGRDALPKSALKYIEQLEKKIKEIGIGKIVTICGRHYAMDRDMRWDRIEKAYNVLVYREGKLANNTKEAIIESYGNNIFDEFISPTIIGDKEKGIVKENDGLIFFNFRPDRARELTWAFVQEDFNGFKREKGRIKLLFVCFTKYDKNLDVTVAFLSQVLKNTLGEYISNLGYSQLRIAETEKYAHVTFFFDGRKETIKKGETRIFVPSPKSYTYDLVPALSAFEITEKLIAAIRAKQYDFIIVNFANCDIIGHTGNFEATVKAVKILDVCIYKIIRELTLVNGIAFLSADHGNAEQMWDEKNDCLYTAHTSNKVPFIIVDDKLIGKNLRPNGILADIAPTMLATANIIKPTEMTGNSLIL